MSIFIFEDDVIQAQHMKQLVQQLCVTHNIPYDFIETTSKEQEIIDKIPQCTYIPIYFLDIEIKNDERKGLHVAQKIRAVDDRGIIVFVTTHSELAPISYQYMVSALTFIDKATPQAKRVQAIRECLQHYIQKNQLQHIEDALVVENTYTSFKVPFHSVEYIMTDEPHRLTLVATNQMIQFYGTLKEMEQLDERLIRCHKSFLVNKQQLMALDSKQQLLMLKSGKSIPVSRRLKGAMKALLKGGESLHV